MFTFWNPQRISVNSIVMELNRRAAIYFLKKQCKLLLHKWKTNKQTIKARTPETCLDLERWELEGKNETILGFPSPSWVKNISKSADLENVSRARISMATLNWSQWCFWLVSISPDAVDPSLVTSSDREEAGNTTHCLWNTNK